MIDGQSKIYAQGSVATSTTIVTATATTASILMPSWRRTFRWIGRTATFSTSSKKGFRSFPGVKQVVRCTRCVQLQFATMHMDVTVMDRRGRIAGERPGEIFHSPDEGNSYRVPSNLGGSPVGFARSLSQGPENLLNV